VVERVAALFAVKFVLVRENVRNRVKAPHALAGDENAKLAEEHAGLGDAGNRRAILRHALTATGRIGLRKILLEIGDLHLDVGRSPRLGLRPRRCPRFRLKAGDLRALVRCQVGDKRPRV
jgi:hypothetical protein